MEVFGGSLWVYGLATRITLIYPKVEGWPLGISLGIPSHPPGLSTTMLQRGDHRGILPRGEIAEHPTERGRLVDKLRMMAKNVCRK